MIYPDVTPGSIPDDSTTCPYTIQTSFTDDAIERAASLIHKLWPSTIPQAENDHPEFCKLYNHIKSFKLPNFLGARVPVHSGPNLYWE